MESLCVALIMDEHGVEECFDFLKNHEKKLSHVQFLIPPEFYTLFKTLKKLQIKTLPIKGIKGWGIVNAMISIEEIDALGVFVHPELYEMSSSYLISLLTGCQDHKIPCFLDNVSAHGLLYLVQQLEHKMEQRLQDEMIAKKEKEALEQFLKKEQLIARSPIHWFEQEQGVQEDPKYSTDSVEQISVAGASTGAHQADIKDIDNPQSSLGTPSSSIRTMMEQNIESDTSESPCQENTQDVPPHTATFVQAEPDANLASIPCSLEEPITDNIPEEASTLPEQSGVSQTTTSNKIVPRKTKRNFKKRVTKKSK